MIEKEKIEISLDYLKCPITLSDIENGELFTGINIIDNDEIVKKLNFEIANMFSNYYEFDSHNEPCWFNKDQEKKDKDKMLNLLNQLINRLNEINDGSYEVVDCETERVKNL